MPRIKSVLGDHDVSAFPAIKERNRCAEGEGGDTAGKARGGTLGPTLKTSFPKFVHEIVLNLTEGNTSGRISIRVSTICDLSYCCSKVKHEEDRQVHRRSLTYRSILVMPHYPILVLPLKVIFCPSFFFVVAPFLFHDPSSCRW